MKRERERMGEREEERTSKGDNIVYSPNWRERDQNLWYPSIHGVGQEVSSSETR